MAILGSVTAGLAVDLGWPDFVRTATVLAAADIANAEKIAIIETAAAALELANAALAEQNEKLATTNMTLSNEVKKLKNQKCLKKPKKLKKKKTKMILTLMMTF